MKVAMEMFTLEKRKLQKEYRILCDQIEQCSKHVERIEPKVYKQTLARTQKQAEHTTPIEMATNEGNTAYTKTSARQTPYDTENGARQPKERDIENSTPI